LARWAALRSAELAERAHRSEGPDPLEAHRLWSRVLCLDPGSALAQEGLRRTAPVRSHQLRAELVIGRRELPAEASPGAWESLDQPIAFPAPAPRTAAPSRARRQPTPAPESPAPGQRRPLEEAERWIRQAEAALRAARFEDALHAAAQARGALGEHPGGAQLAGPRVRLEVAAATAQIGLGEDAAAQESLRRAVEAQPGLRLDPATTSPKVLRALDLARAARRGRP
jgi:hypothetical protein